MAESRLVSAAREWVTRHYPYNREHLLRALDWLDDLAPASSEAVRIATLTHDMERAFPGPDSPQMSALDDPDYVRLHCERSARIVGAWLHARQAPDALVRDVQRLILAHEDGGWPEADLLQAADSLSFLDTNVDLFLGFVREGRFPASDVRWKFEHTYDRIRVPRARTIALPMFREACAKLAALERTLPTPVPGAGGNGRGALSNVEGS